MGIIDHHLINFELNELAYNYNPCWIGWYNLSIHLNHVKNA